MLDVNERPFRAGSGFHHQALFYAGDDEFVSAAVAFLRVGLTAHEPILVVVDQHKIELLRAALGADADRITFADMRAIGHNPARILPAWQKFIDAAGPSAVPIRGIGEPIWPGRSEAELLECRFHEALLNVAFDGGRSLHLLCPYDMTSLDAEVVEGAMHTHPFVRTEGEDRSNSDYAGALDASRIFNDLLPPPATEPATMRFSVGPLHDVRRFVTDHARGHGLDAVCTADLVLAANEMASNSMLHGGGSGLVCVWHDGDALLCEIRDAGHIDDVMVGRVHPGPDDTQGRGVWMANQLCDLVQVRSSSTGTVVRLHMRAC